MALLWHCGKQSAGWLGQSRDYFAANGRRREKVRHVGRHQCTATHQRRRIGFLSAIPIGTMRLGGSASQNAPWWLHAMRIVTCPSMSTTGTVGPRGTVTDNARHGSSMPLLKMTLLDVKLSAPPNLKPIVKTTTTLSCVLGVDLVHNWNTGVIESKQTLANVQVILYSDGRRAQRQMRRGCATKKSISVTQQKPLTGLKITQFRARLPQPRSHVIVDRGCCVGKR